MNKGMKYIGFWAPAVISDALRDRKRQTGVSVARQVIKALERQLKVKVDYGTSHETSGNLPETADR